MSKDIRIGYSGFISFVSRILSLFTGLVFITLITRNLSQYDFGLWQFILSVVTYSVLPNAIVDYWVVRDLARGERHATTALLFSMLLSLGGISVYIIISLLSAPRVQGEYIV
jgi:O-antigen/teichoic acid export membrane protein